MSFDYFKPQSLSELFKMKKDYSFIYAGGTDILVDIRSGKKKVENLLDIKGIKDFYGIREVSGGIEIGAGETFSSLLENPLIKKIPALKEAASVMGCAEIRARATVGGNICNASPGCETGVVFSAYEAKVNIASADGKRTENFEDFITGSNKTSLKQDEVALSIFVPIPEEHKSFYKRVSRNLGMDLACWNACAVILNPSAVEKREVRFSIGTVLPVPFRDKEAEKMLSFKKVSRSDIENAYESVVSKIAPRASSIRATPDEKKRAIKNFLDELGGFLK